MNKFLFRGYKYIFYFLDVNFSSFIGYNNIHIGLKPNYSRSLTRQTIVLDLKGFSIPVGLLNFMFYAINLNYIDTKYYS